MSELIFLVGLFLFVGLFIYRISFYNKEYVDESDNEIYNHIIQNLDKASLTTQYNQICINGVYINLYGTDIYINGSCLICNSDISPIVNKIESLQTAQNKLRNQKLCSQLKSETCQS